MKMLILIWLLISLTLFGVLFISDWLFRTFPQSGLCKWLRRNLITDEDIE